MFLTTLSAQEQSIRFEQITTEEGLSQSTINSILQDKRGFLWFATEDGLNRYDGYNFRVYRNDPSNELSLSNNRISTILEDKSGRLWIGTKGGGLSRFNKEKETFTNFINDSKDSKSLSDNFITTLFEDQSGVILVGTQSGLNILDPDKNTFTVYSEMQDHLSLRKAHITSILKDHKDFIWIGTEKEGLYQFDRETGQIKRFSKDTPNTQINDNWVVTLYEDSEYNLWVGTQSGGLLKYDDISNAFISFTSVNTDKESISNNWVLSLFEDSRGTFWVGTLNGLNILDRDSGAFISFMDLKYPTNLSNNSITSLFEDRSGVFWVGTRNGALNKFIRSSSESFTVYQNDPSNSNSLSNNNIWAVAEDDEGAIWIGTQGGGVDKLNKNKNTFTNYKNQISDKASLSNDFINDIFKDSKGDIWIATINGLNHYRNESDDFEVFRKSDSDESSLSGNIITTIFEDSKGILWVGTLNNGLNAFDKESRAFRRFQHVENKPNSISHNKIWSMFEDDSGIFWVGTHGYGLNKYDRVRGTFTTYMNKPNDESSLRDNFVNTIEQGKDGTLWIGTINGLNKFNPSTETFTRFTTKDGLPNNVIYGMIEDYRGNLWLSTNSGIADFNPTTSSIRIYDRGDGLPSNEYRFGAYHLSDDGTMYFGGINGLVEFMPDSIRDNPYIPPVVITDFKILNQDVLIDDENSPLKKSIIETSEMVLTWEDRVISFEFAALHFASPEQNMYQYMMEGFDEDWQYVGNRRFVSYTNLPQDKNYTFRVRASNKDGIWNEVGTAIDLTILPPPWKTLWAYGIYSFLGIGCLFGFVNFQISKERKKKQKLEEYNDELEELVKDRTILLESEKEKSDALLYNMLPREIADEIKEKGSADPRRYEEVSVLFTDFENFTSTAATMSAKKLVFELNEIFQAFDIITEEYGLEKIKTIGDAYMAVSGLPVEKEDHAYLCIRAAKEMQAYIENRNENAAIKWKMRIGIHSGSIIAGIVGKKKFTYDIWGSTVILASRMEEVGEVERINISATTCDHVQDKFKCEYRGKVNVEGQGEMDMYFVGEEVEANKD